MIKGNDETPCVWPTAVFHGGTPCTNKQRKYDRYNIKFVTLYVA